MKKLLISLLIVSLASGCFARGFSSSSSRGYSSGGFRSSSSYSRSYSSPRSYSTPSRTIVRNNTTVIHHDHSHGGGSGSGFFTGMLMGHMLSSNSAPVVVQQPAVVQQQPTVMNAPDQQVITQPAVVETSGISIFWILIFILVCLFVFVPLVSYLARRAA